MFSAGSATAARIQSIMSRADTRASTPSFSGEKVWFGVAAAVIFVAFVLGPGRRATDADRAGGQGRGGGDPGRDVDRLDGFVVFAAAAAVVTLFIFIVGPRRRIADADRGESKSTPRILPTWIGFRSTVIVLPTRPLWTLNRSRRRRCSS